MHNCVPFLHQLRAQALLVAPDDGSPATPSAQAGNARSRESIAQQ
jgi:hypothetical protein